MSQILTLRPARNEDHEFLYRLFYLTQEEKLKLFYLSQEAKARLIGLIYSGFESHYQTLAPTADDRLILLDDEPIGRMIILQSRDELRLADLALLPQRRNRGIGTALIGELQTESVMTKRPLRLQAGTFDRVLRLYQRLGFYKTDTSGPYLLLEWSQRFSK